MEWKEGAAEPDNAKQYFLTKLRTVAQRAIGHLAVMEKRWDKGLKLIKWYNSFRRIANTRGPGQTILSLQLGKVEMDDVLKDISKGNEEVNDWATGVSEYFGVDRIGEYQDAMKFFLTGAGFDLEDKIDWVKLKNLLENKNIEAVKLVSDEIKASDQMSEVSTPLTTLGDTMLKIKKMTDKPEESEKDKKEDKRRLEVRNGFKEKFERWYQQIVGNYYKDGELKKLEANRGNLIKYNEIVKTLSNTWADIRNHDSDFVEVKMLW